MTIETFPGHVRSLGPETGPGRARPHFTIATLVTDAVQYSSMVRSLVKGGFTPDDCEYLAIDNRPEATGCPAAGRIAQTDAFSGLNRALTEARGDYVILCHQDIRLLEDDRAVLERKLDELDHLDPAWALAGNAGATGPGELALRITDPHGRDQRTKALPARVMSLDENWIVVRKAARIGFSRDLEGFHLYGADLCMTADLMGWHAYVIDFHLEHLSPGKKDASFDAAAHRFEAKWSRALRPRLMQTTCTRLPIAPGMFQRAALALADRPVTRALKLLDRTFRRARKVKASTQTARATASSTPPLQTRKPKGGMPA